MGYKISRLARAEEECFADDRGAGGWGRQLQAAVKFETQRQRKASRVARQAKKTKNRDSCQASKQQAFFFGLPPPEPLLPPPLLPPQPPQPPPLPPLPVIHSALPLSAACDGSAAGGGGGSAARSFGIYN
jgi:hypothetical protein